MVNFKNSLVTIARNLEALFLQQIEVVKKTVNRIMETIGKWQPKKGSITKAKAAIIEIPS